MTGRLIYLDSPLRNRDAVCGWARKHGIDPMRAVTGYPVTIDDEARTVTLRYLKPDWRSRSMCGAQCCEAKGGGTCACRDDPIIIHPTCCGECLSDWVTFQLESPALPFPPLPWPEDAA